MGPLLLVIWIMFWLLLGGAWWARAVWIRSAADDPMRAAKLSERAAMKRAKVYLREH